VPAEESELCEDAAGFHSVDAHAPPANQVSRPDHSNRLGAALQTSISAINALCEQAVSLPTTTDSPKVWGDGWHAAFIG
jgi:hypothetical protein